MTCPDCQFTKGHATDCPQYDNEHRREAIYYEETTQYISFDEFNVECKVVPMKFDGNEWKIISSVSPYCPICKYTSGHNVVCKWYNNEHCVVCSGGCRGH